MTSNIQKISATETATFVRADLKKTFPNVRFRVVTRKYAGGATVEVSWFDGPTSERVRSLLADYVGVTGESDFDLTLRTTTRNGDRVRYAITGISTQRSSSEAFVRSIVDAYVTQYALTQTPVLRVERSGHTSIDQKDPHRDAILRLIQEKEA